MVDTRVTPDIDGLTAARTLIRSVRALEGRMRLIREDDALSLSELGVLGQIDRGHTLPSVLARVMGLDPARVTRIADRLVAIGYIDRVPDASDRRCLRLGLTEAGKRRLEVGRADCAEAMAGLLAGLTDEEAAGLWIGVQGLRRVLNAP